MPMEYSPDPRLLELDRADDDRDAKIQKMKEDRKKQEDDVNRKKKEDRLAEKEK